MIIFGFSVVHQGTLINYVKNIQTFHLCLLSIRFLRKLMNTVCIITEIPLCFLEVLIAKEDQYSQKNVVRL